jgi:hypothetical protein
VKERAEIEGKLNEEVRRIGQGRGQNVPHSRRDRVPAGVLSISQRSLNLDTSACVVLSEGAADRARSYSSLRPGMKYPRLLRRSKKCEGRLVNSHQRRRLAQKTQLPQSTATDTGADAGLCPTIFLGRGGVLRVTGRSNLIEPHQQRASNHSRPPSLSSLISIYRSPMPDPAWISYFFLAPLVIVDT